MTKTVRLLAELLIVFHCQMGFMEIEPAHGLDHTNTNTNTRGLPPSEGRSYAGAANVQPRKNRWSSRTASGLLGRTTNVGGHYRDRHRPLESDPDLLVEERRNNRTQIVHVDHAYYTSTIYGPGDAASKELWVNVEDVEEDEWKVHGFLSGPHRQAERVNLSFGFPFYGHIVKELTVASGGFIYTGDIIHRMLTATQYIAPLMANFAPSLSQNSTVFYFDNGTSLVVQWNHIHLQGLVGLGTFTFQAVLHSDGRIVFAYKEVPVDIDNISTQALPVKVGLSDAFVVLHELEQIPNVRRTTIYEYHKVDILKSKISSSTAVELLPLPTCLQFSSCAPCVSAQIGFNCSWCSRLQRCSSGFDRYRQDWVDHGCLDESNDITTPVPVTTVQQRNSSMTSTPLRNASTVGNPSAHSSTSRRTTSSPESATSKPADDGTNLSFHEAAGGEKGTGATGRRLQLGLLAGIIVMVIVLAAAVLLSVYMYNHPMSSASLFFMERRPTRWPIMKFRRGSGCPSYAEVEAPGQDKDTTVVIDPKQSFVMSSRRESEQKEGFIIPDQRERFLVSESS